MGSVAIGHVNRHGSSFWFAISAMLVASKNTTQNTQDGAQAGSRKVPIAHFSNDHKDGRWFIFLGLFPH